MKQKRENELILKQWTRVFILIIDIVIIIASIVSVVKGLNPEAAGKEELYSYTYNSNLEYQVYLVDNSFFTSPYIEMNKQYITSLIDYINVNASYSFESTEELDYSYSYSIVATAKGLSQNSSGEEVEIWSREYPLDSQDSQTGTGKAFTIEKNIQLDYNQYNDIMTEFRSQFGISVDARVDLTIKINIVAGLAGADEKELQTANTMTLEIPLLEQSMTITPNYVNSGGDTIYSTEETSATVNVISVVASAIILVAALFAFKLLVKSLLVVTRKSEYVLALNKILKDYADIIAETHNMPDLEKYDIINVKTFEDMVDIEEELHSPILYFEITENVECIFIIISNSTIYRFILRESDFDHFVKKENFEQ